MRAFVLELLPRSSRPPRLPAADDAPPSRSHALVAMAISAVDCALWDLKAKILDISLATLFGPVRVAVPLPDLSRPGCELEFKRADAEKFRV